MNQFRKFRDLTSVLMYMDSNHIDISKMIDIIQKDRIIAYPISPIKPRLSIKHTSIQAIQYAHDLKQFEEDRIQYKNKLVQYQEETDKINELIALLVKDQSGLRNIPEQYQDKIYSYAINAAKGNGMLDVYYNLCDLVDIFN